MKGKRWRNDSPSKRKVLVVTPCPPNGLPTQGLKIAEELIEAGFRTHILSRAQSSLVRVLDIVVCGIFLVPFCDVVLVNLYGKRAFVYEAFIILYGYMWKKRIVAFVRSGMMPQFVQKWPRFARMVFKRCQALLVPNKYLEEKLTALELRVDGVIPNFIDLSQYSFKERSYLQPRFLYVRGLWSVYNPEMALRAFSIIQDTYPSASLTMVGREGDCSTLCRNLVHELDLRNVEFVGLVKKAELIEIAGLHDIHLHTNRSENMPVSIIEMWACGLPIVGTNVGGMSFLVRNYEDAILVESEDYKTMAKVCNRLLSDPNLTRFLSSNGRKRAEALTWDCVKDNWMKTLFVEK